MTPPAYSNPVGIDHKSCLVHIKGNDRPLIDLAAQEIRARGYHPLKDTDAVKISDLVLNLEKTTYENSVFSPCMVNVTLEMNRKEVHRFKTERSEPKSNKDPGLRCAIAAKAAIETFPKCSIKIRPDAGRENQQQP